MAGVSTQRMRYMLLVCMAALTSAFSLHFKGVYAPLAAEVSTARADVARLEGQLADFETIIAAADERRALAEQAREELRHEAEASATRMSEVSATMPNALGLYAVYENLFTVARDADLEPVSLRRTDPIDAKDGANVRGADVERVLAGFRGDPQGMFQLLGGVANSELPILLHGVSLVREGEGMVMNLDLSFLVSDAKVGTAQPAPFALAHVEQVEAFGLIEAAAAAVPQQMELQATLFGPRGKVAVIDGQMVYELGAVGDATVLEIMDGRALVERAGVRFLLEVGQAGDKS
jgi:hypothetical protein